MIASNLVANIIPIDLDLFIDEETATNSEKILLYGLNIIELVLIIISLLMSCFIIKICFKVHIFHRNLIILCGYLFLGCFFWMMSQLIIVVYGFFDFKVLAFQQMVVNQGPMIYVEWVKLSAGASLMANLLIMVMERAVATILLRSYERKTGDRWMIAAFFVILVCGIIGASIVITGKFLKLINVDCFVINELDICLNKIIRTTLLFIFL